MTYELNEREQEAIRAVHSFFPLALSMVEQSVADSIYLSFTTPHRDGLIDIRNKDKNLFAKFYAIQTIANGEQTFGYNRDMDFMMVSRRMELLKLMIDDGFIDPKECEDWKSFAVIFRYTFVCNLQAGNAFQFEKMLKFAQVLYGWSGRLPTSRFSNPHNVLFSQLIVDSFRCWFEALKKLHPNLSIWKHFAQNLVPYNAGKWPIRIDKTRELLIRRASDLKAREAEKVLTSAHRKLNNKLLQLLVLGKSEEELRQQDISEFIDDK